MRLADTNPVAVMNAVLAKARKYEREMPPAMSAQVQGIIREIESTIQAYNSYQLDRDEYVEKAAEYTHRLDNLTIPYEEKKKQDKIEAEKKKQQDSIIPSLPSLGVSPWLIGAALAGGVVVAYLVKRRR